jgi:hypothetical protein
MATKNTKRHENEMAARVSRLPTATRLHNKAQGRAAHLGNAASPTNTPTGFHHEHKQV